MKKLLLVIDYQYDFVAGSLGFPKAKDLEEIIYKKIESYQKQGDEIIFTLDTHREDYMQTVEGRNLPIKHCLQDSSGRQLYGRIKEFENAGLCFEKETFPSLDLANYLKGREYEHVELCGLVSNICVLANAVMVKAALPNTEIIVDAKATASFDEHLHEECLDIMAGLHIKVLNR
ncbi:MAG: cysteine hydrolase [Acholeplasmataceae bacterium]|nr:cysteine hydrolase [Acholeplasmataceae bacterium]